MKKTKGKYKKDSTEQEVNVMDEINARVEIWDGSAVVGKSSEKELSDNDNAPQKYVNSWV